MGRSLTVGLLSACLLGQAAAGDAPPEALLADAAREAAAGNLGTATDLLATLEADGVAAPLRQQADLLAGVLLVQQDRDEEGIPPLERAAATYPLLADYALAYLATAQRRAGRPAEAAAALRRLLDQHPESLFVERAGRNLPRDLLEAGDLPQAEEAAGKYLAAFPGGPARAEVWVTLGEVLQRAGRTEQAEQVFRRVWVELPGSPESQRATEILATIPGARPFSAEEQFQRATTLYHLGRHGQALLELAPFAEAGSPKEGQARLLLGIAAFRLRQYGQAVRWLEPLRDMAGAERAQLLYWLARSFGRAGDSVKLEEHMILLADTAAQTRWAEEGLFLLAQAAADNGEAARARAHLSRLLREYPRSAWTDSALWLRGWLAYRERDLKGALRAWERLLAKEPGSPHRTPALYWRARVLELAKKPQQAASAYRAVLQAAPDRDYYWFRARERLARLGKKVPQPPALTDGPGARVASSDTLRMKKARALRQVGLEEEAVEEYGEQIRTRPEDRGGLAEACRAFLDLQRYDKAVWLAARLLRPVFVQESGRPPIRGFWRCLYPLGHWPLVDEQARHLGLDPYLVTALIREESAFAPRAVSSAGARGLMQLMQPTAERIAREHRLTLGPAAPLEAPEVNVRLGTLHLAELLRDSAENLTLALASYNAGSHHVRGWKDRYGFADEEEFTESIPFTETRNYVKRVLGSYQRYATLYGSGRAESREAGAEKKRAGAERRGSGGERKKAGAGNKRPGSETRKVRGD